MEKCYYWEDLVPGVSISSGELFATESLRHRILLQLKLLPDYLFNRFD